MTARICPTCRKSNCGNHAACARRAQTLCPRCKRSPCPDKIKCQDTYDGLQLVAIVEEALQRAYTPEEMARWTQEQRSLARKAALEVLYREAVRKQEQERLRALGRLFLLGRF